MRNRIGDNFDVSNGEHLVRIDFIDVCNTGESLGLAAQCAVSKPHREIELARQSGHTTDVIAVFVSYDNSAQLFGGNPKPSHTRNSVLQSETTIHQYQRPADFGQQRIAFATATQ